MRNQRVTDGSAGDAAARHRPFMLAESAFSKGLISGRMYVSGPVFIPVPYHSIRDDNVTVIPAGPTPATVLRQHQQCPLRL